MALYNFIDKVGPAVPAVYLNELDQIRNVVSAPPTINAFNVNQPMTVNQLMTAVATAHFNFANDSVVIDANEPTLRFRNGGAVLNEKNWIMFARAAGAFDFRAVNDALNADSTIFTVDRTGVVVDSITFPVLSVFRNVPTSSLNSSLRLQDVNNPILTLHQTGAAANEKVWNFVAVAGELRGRVSDDTGAGDVNWLVVDRTGTTIDTVLFPNGRVAVGAFTSNAKMEITQTAAQTALLLTSSSAGSSVITVLNVTNSVNADFYVQITQPSATPFVVTGPSTAAGWTFQTAAQERIRIASTGNIYMVSIGTTASPANAFLNSGSTPANELLRSTSSIRYKTDVQDLTDAEMNVLDKLRPITYRSLCECDDKAVRWLGLIAEEVAEHAPRLVHYTRGKDDSLIPDGVQYERLGVLMLKKLQLMEGRLKNLETKAGIDGR